MIKNLKELRISKGLTQVDVAVAVGASLSSYRMWEKGVTTPNPENKVKLLEFLEIKEEG